MLSWKDALIGLQILNVDHPIFCLLERATSAAASSYVTPSLSTKEKEISAKIEHLLIVE